MNHLQFEFSALNWELTVKSDPFSCSVVDIGNDQVIWQLRSIGFRSTTGDWQTIQQVDVKEVEPDECLLGLLHDGKPAIELKIKIQEISFDIKIRSLVEDIEWVSLGLTAQEEEHFVGFGERFDSIDQRGKQIMLWVEDGACMDLTYIPVPFYMSSRGYGVLLDTSVKSFFHMATEDDPRQVLIRTATLNVDMKVFLGPSFYWCDRR